MSLAAGASVGHYRVTTLLGQGGMGEVYRAHDSRLKRDVALKILPEFFASDPDRRARFQREAQVLASLNHPHVASIYGLEETGGHWALVLELVEGETLADRVATGPIPVADALPMAQQVAEALEYAHEHGVVHRDLKPSNIKLAPDGTVKVLDFGLAKLTDDGVSRLSYASESPTVAAVSQVGVLLGTAAYMSPEQARRKAVDKRSDVWAFGCVLYEMLTGRRLFEGEEIADILANVLKSPLDWTRLPADTPAAIRTLLRRCLERDRARRLPDIGSARLEIADAIGAVDEPSAPRVAARTAWIPWTFAAAGVVIAAIAVVMSAPWRSTTAAPAMRLAIELGTDAEPMTLLGPALALSPDGSTLALLARPSSGQSQLYVRRLNELRAVPLAGTEGAQAPFFSPDGAWIGFFASNALKKIAVSGGAAINLADVSTPLGGTWTERDTIIYVPAPGALREVPASGGTPVTITPKMTGAAVWPQAIPGRNAVILTSTTGPGGLAQANVVAYPVGGEPRVLVRGGFFGRYVESGHLIYVSQGTVFAAPFDVDALAISGNAVPVQEGMQITGAAGAVQFATSRAGTAAYLGGGAQPSNRPLSWLDSRGTVTPIASELGIWGTPRFAPDGNRLAISRLTAEGNLDVWTYDLERETLGRVTFDPVPETAPVWSTDSRRIVFSVMSRPGVFNLFWKRADGTGDTQRLTDSPLPQLPSSWHPTRPILAFYDGAPPNPQRVMLLELDGDEAAGWKPRQPVEFASGPYRSVAPMFSPDGNWLAYVSDKSGRLELYVRPFPGPGDEVQVSSGGANDPQWSKRRQELLYSTFAPTVNATGQIMVASYTVQGGVFKPEKPRPWVPRTLQTPPFGQFGVNLALHPDGQRVVFADVPKDPSGSGREPLIIVSRFLDELRQRVGTGR